MINQHLLLLSRMLFSVVTAFSSWSLDCIYWRLQCASGCIPPPLKLHSMLLRPSVPTYFFQWPTKVDSQWLKARTGEKPNKSGVLKRHCCNCPTCGQIQILCTVSESQNSHSYRLQTAWKRLVGHWHVISQVYIGLDTPQQFTVSGWPECVQFSG